MLIDERVQCVYYPSTGAGGQALAMNGVPALEVHNNAIAKLDLEYQFIICTGQHQGPGVRVQF